MTEMRKDRRAPASLKVKYKSATVEDFIEQFGADVSRGGIFIKTKKPLETGALLKFEFQLQGGTAVIHGVGRVAWRRSEEQARPDLPAGMGIKFIKLDEQSRTVIERIEARHGAGSRFDNTEAAELAPPISSLPPGTPLSPPPAAPRSVAPGARPTPLVPGPLSGTAGPANQIEAPIGKPSVAAALAAARLPKAVSGTSSSAIRAQMSKPAISPAALAAPTFRPPPPASMSSIPPAFAEPAPRTADKPVSVPIAAPKGALGGNASARRSAPGPRSAARDASEFLASAFSAGGAGQEVRSQARAQVEQARHDPHSVDLANELFGDLSEPSKKSMPPEAAAEASFGDVLGELEPAATEAKPRASEEPSANEQTPSIEELVNEAAHANPGRNTAQSAEAAARAADAEAVRSVNPSGLAANDQAPLTLDLSHTAAQSGSAAQPSGGSRAALYAVLAVVFLGVAYGAFYFMRGKSDTAAQSTEPQPSAAVQPTAAPAEPAKPAEPAPAAAPATVSVSLQSEPAGAEVMVDGKPQGSTPATLSLTPGTEVELSLKHPGFGTKTEKLKVEPSTPAQSFKLEPLPYELTIITEPKGARVTAGALTAESPKPLVLGHVDAPVELSVEKNGYQRLTRTVELSEFKEDGSVMRGQLTISLTAAPVAVSARKAAPANARVAAPPPPEPGEAAPPPPDAPVVQIKPAEEAAPPAAAASPEAAAKPAEPAPPPPAAAAEPPAPASP